MHRFWLAIVKPKSFYAKWLIFITLLALVVAGSLGQFEQIRSVLDTTRFTFAVGSYSISLYDLLKALVILALVFWVTAIAIDTAEDQIGHMTHMRSSNRALILKFTQIVFYVIAGIIALDFIGVDLTTFTVFSGALGIGLGFGLQKIASNFISGLILLMEKSIEEGDLIELADGTVGFVRKASARYTLIETFDSKEILVPNEDLITSRVTNWTFSNSKGRVEIRIGVSYQSDIELARELILEAAREHPRCIDDPPAKCFLMNYGDSSVDFVLHFWVADVVQGRWEPQSDVLFTIWRKFKDNNIEIPFPQRDLHIKNPQALKAEDHGHEHE